MRAWESRPQKHTANQMKYINMVCLSDGPINQHNVIIGYNSGMVLAFVDQDVWRHIKSQWFNRSFCDFIAVNVKPVVT